MKKPASNLPRLGKAALLAAAALPLAGCVSLLDREVRILDDGRMQTRATLFNIHFDRGSPLRLYENVPQDADRIPLLPVWVNTYRASEAHPDDLSSGQLLLRAISLQAAQNGGSAGTDQLQKILDQQIKEQSKRVAEHEAAVKKAREWDALFPPVPTPKP